MFNSTYSATQIMYEEDFYIIGDEHSLEYFYERLDEEPPITDLLLQSGYISLGEVLTIFNDRKKKLGHLQLQYYNMKEEDFQLLSTSDVPGIVLLSKPIPITGLQSILSNPNLESLCVSNCYLTDEHIGMIAEHLSKNQLTSLDISDNVLTPTSIKLIRESVASNKSLTHLDLQKCYLDIDSVMFILENNTGLLDFRFDNVLNNENFNKIIKFNLQSLSVVVDNEVDFSGLADNDKLEILTITGNCRPRYVDVPCHRVANLSEALAQNTTIKTLTIRKFLTKSNFRVFANLFRSNNTIEIFETDKRFDIGEIKWTLMSALESNYTLHTVENSDWEFHEMDELHKFLSEENRMKRMHTVRRALTTKSARS